MKSACKSAFWLNLNVPYNRLRIFSVAFLIVLHFILLGQVDKRWNKYYLQTQNLPSYLGSYHGQFLRGAQRDNWSHWTLVADWVIWFNLLQKLKFWTFSVFFPQIQQREHTRVVSTVASNFSCICTGLFCWAELGPAVHFARPAEALDIFFGQVMLRKLVLIPRMLISC